MAFIWLLLYLVVLYLRPGEWIPFFATWRLVPLVTAGSLFFLGFQLAVTKQPPPKIPHTRLMLGLFAAVIGSQLIHGYMAGATSAFNEFLPNLTLYLLIVNIVNSQAKFKMTLWVLVLLSAFMAAQGIQQYWTGVGWAGQPPIWETGSWQARITWLGIFADPNDLALAFVIVVPVLLSMLFARSFFLLKLLPMALTGLLVYGIYLTNSRGGMLALMASIAFFFIRRSRWVVPGTFFGGSCAMLAFLFGPSRLGMGEMDDSAYARLDAWYYGFQLLKENPVLGAGQNMFTDDYPLTAHNSFVLAFAELGIVGFLCWVGLLYVAFRGLALLKRHPNPLIPRYAVGLQASLVGFASAAFFLSRTYTVLPYLLAGLCGALSNVARLQVKEFEYVFTRKDLRNILWTSLGILVLLQVAMKTWL